MAGTKFPQPNQQVLAAWRRRIANVAKRRARIEWFIDKISTRVRLTVEQRVALATTFLRDEIVRNISIPVIKGKGPRGGRVVTGRSKPGEYPHADTTQLRKSIMSDVREVNLGVYEGYVGTPLDYGLILETRMDRSFLVRTLQENLFDLERILSGPIA